MRVNLISMLLWWSWIFASELLVNCIYVICIVDASEHIFYDALKIVIWLFSMRLDNYEIDLLACLFIFVDELYYGKNPGVYDSWKKCNEQVDA